MKVAFVHGSYDLRVNEVEAPTAGPRDVVLRIASVGICGSDLGFISVGGPGVASPNPFPLGHELSGTVEQAGPEVTSVKVGDRVILNPLVNMIGNGAPEGGFGEKLLVRDVAGKPGSLLPLPDAMSFDEGALIEPLAVGAHAVNRLGAKPGDTVAIYGAGPIGLASLIALKRRGIDSIIMFDLSGFRRERALKLGASAAFDPKETPAAKVLSEAHGTVSMYGYDLPATTHYIEASGAPVIPDIVGFCRPGAVICVASLQKKTIEIHPAALIGKEITLTGVLGYPTELGEVLEALTSSPIDLEPMISHRFKGEDVLTAFDMATHPEQSAKVLVQYES